MIVFSEGKQFRDEAGNSWQCVREQGAFKMRCVDGARAGDVLPFPGAVPPEVLDPEQRYEQGKRVDLGDFSDRMAAEPGAPNDAAWYRGLFTSEFDGD